MGQYAIIKNLTQSDISINFKSTQVDDFVLGPGESQRVEAYPEILHEIKYGEIKYHIDKGRISVSYTETGAVETLSLADLSDCDGYGIGHNNVVRGDDPRIQAIGSIPVEDSFTLTSNQINVAKSVILTFTPSAGYEPKLLPIGGIEQQYGIDYTVTGTTLLWDGLGLDGFLEIGEILKVSYRRDA
jgi:hypothetical protein